MRYGERGIGRSECESWNSEINGRDPPQFVAALRYMIPNGYGLTVLPFLTGERSPGWHGHTRATIQGISQATTPLEIVRAGMESVACRIALVFKKLVKLLPDDLQINVNKDSMKF